VFTAGGTDVSHLEADVVSISTNLADRSALARELASIDADTYLVEVKAAAVDVVAEHALAHDRRIVLASNDVVPLRGDLDAALLDLVPARVGAP
jgi:cyclic 2,3-diphosphoglycerate synthetase